MIGLDQTGAVGNRFGFCIDLDDAIARHRLRVHDEQYVSWSSPLPMLSPTYRLGGRQRDTLFLMHALIALSMGLYFLVGPDYTAGCPSCSMIAVNLELAVRG